MSRSAGPGPGAYMLPTTVGYNDHDARKQRLPQYSFGLRAPAGDRRFGPGPGAYMIEKMTRYGVSRGNEYTMGARIFSPSTKSCGPGPGAHDVHLKPFFKGTNAPAYTMKWKNDISAKGCGPGPSAYMVNVNPIKQGSPAYSMGLRTDFKTGGARTPGPAAYGATDLNVAKLRMPQFSMGSRNDMKSKRFGPGPNNYNLSYYRPGRGGQAYSFGIRHGPNAPPMIVPCDNA